MAKLKKFTVELERTTVLQYEYEITAKSEEEATALAEVKCIGDPHGDLLQDDIELADCYETDEEGDER